MMWDGFNKRKFPRIQVQCQIVIHPDTQPEPVSTVTENIGEKGVCVMLPRQLERFSRCRIKLELEKTTTPIECTARAVWVVPTKDIKARKSNFDTGFEFLDMNESSSKMIREFIDTRLEKEPS